ncbi:MAG: hypothetical protein GX020_05690 [Firmicutes bacterium]|nr:hypothetical protein [Bacillota bacterium]
MLGNISSIISILLIGLVIKTMDDAIDDDSDISRRFFPYIILLFTGALLLNFNLAISLFLASYAVGMFFEPFTILPTGLPSWVETILALIASILLTSITQTIWAVLIIFSIQLLDDIIDVTEDEQRGFRNVANKIGISECILLFLLFTFCATKSLPILSVVSLVSSLIISEIIFPKIKREEVFDGGFKHD